MKKILAFLCAASALLACNKVNDNTTPEEGNLDQKIVSFKFSVKQDGGDTKAKEGFEPGDKVLVFFEGVAEKYVTLSYDGSTWTATPSEQLYTSDFSGKNMKLNAIHFPSFVGEVTVSYESSSFSFKSGDEYIYTYYMYAENVTYEVSATEITATIEMYKPAGFVQFFVPGTSASNGYRLVESHLQPKACSSIAVDGEISTDAKTAGYAVKGYPASNNSISGTMFSCYVTSTGESTSYSFSLVTYISEEKPAALGTQTLSGTKNINSGVILNLPAPSGTWSTITPFVDLGYAGAPLWATGNLDKTNSEIVDPLQAGEYFMYGYSTPYNGGNPFYTGTENPLSTDHDAAYKANNAWRIPTIAQLEALIASSNTTTDWKVNWTDLGGDKAGRLITSKVNGISLFLAATGAYVDSSLILPNMGFYWSSTPYNDTNAWDINFGYGGIGAHEDAHRRFGFPVRPVKDATVVPASGTSGENLAAWD